MIHITNKLYICPYRKYKYQKQQYPLLMGTTPWKFEAKPMSLMFEPLTGFTTKNLGRLLVQNKFRLGPLYLPRFIYATTMGTILSPLRIRESRQYKEIIKQTQIKDDPLFLLGHWRSGTTFLHNLMSLDSSFGYCTTYHTVIPEAFLASEKITRPLVESSLPPTRPQDNVELHPDTPQEEEYALGALSPYSFYNGWIFPQNMNFYYRCVTFKDTPAYIEEEFKKTYSYFLKKITLYNKGKRLVLKNPSNTARIKQLLELFPNSQYINLIRNPYTLYVSMMRFVQITIPLYSVQSHPTIEQAEDEMIQLYADMYQNYLDQRNLIPNGNLVEIKYEELAAKPKETIEQIYKDLKLNSYDKAKQSILKHIESQKNYKTNTQMQLSDDIKDKLSKRWAHVFKAFDYET